MPNALVQGDVFGVALLRIAIEVWVRGSGLIRGIKVGQEGQVGRDG